MGHGHCRRRLRGPACELRDYYILSFISAFFSPSIFPALCTLFHIRLHVVNFLFCWNPFQKFLGAYDIHYLYTKRYDHISSASLMV